jgi:hypothetical protein
LVALGVGGVAVVFERGEPGWDPSAGELVDFYVANRTELLVQSLLFVLSAGLFLWFFAGLRSYLDRAEGHSGRVSSVVYAAGLVWVVLEMAMQAPQIALARVAGGGLEPQVAAVVNDVGLALATIAAVPVVVLVTAVGVLALRGGVLPAWVGWLSLLTAVSHLLAWFGVVMDDGPLVPGGWVTLVVYPVFVVWLVAVIVVMIGRADVHRTRRTAPPGPRGSSRHRACWCLTCRARALGPPGHDVLSSGTPRRQCGLYIPQGVSEEEEPEWRRSS